MGHHSPEPLAVKDNIYTFRHETGRNEFPTAVLDASLLLDLCLFASLYHCTHCTCCLSFPLHSVHACSHAGSPDEGVHRHRQALKRDLDCPEALVALPRELTARERARRQGGKGIATTGRHETDGPRGRRDINAFRHVMMLNIDSTVHCTVLQIITKEVLLWLHIESK